MRVAVIGCGFFAQNHLNGWRDLAVEGVELVAVCDIDPKKAEAAAKAFGVPRFYTDADALLEKEQLDFVDIVTRMESHLRDGQARRGSRRRHHPAEATGVRLERSARSRRDGARKAGVRLAIHENFRWQSPMRKLKGVIDSGAIGKPTWARDRLPDRLRHLRRPALSASSEALCDPRCRNSHARSRALLSRRRRTRVVRDANPQSRRMSARTRRPS